MPKKNGEGDAAIALVGVHSEYPNFKGSVKSIKADKRFRYNFREKHLLGMKPLELLSLKIIRSWVTA